jgi:hypothetical protein
VFERPADPANGSAPFPEWDIRRNVA